jgi:ubiquinone/menaquinone biosynthesis C-methylase UbiE
MEDNYYKGDKGKQYFEARQNENDEYRYFLNAKFFTPFIKENSRVLEFGSGSGKLMYGIKQSVSFPFELFGFEINDTSVNAANEKGLHTTSDFSLIEKQGPFDVIYTSHVLEHISDIQKELLNLKKLLRKGGKLVVLLPIDDWKNKYQQSFSKNDIDKHLHTWTPRLFANNLFELDFEVSECKVIRQAWHPKLFWLIKLAPNLMQRILSTLLKSQQLYAVSYVNE